jgi:DNA adenine methylase
VPRSSCLKIHGGKSYLAEWIVSKMCPHLNYVEPYAGGLAVLFARDPNDERLWLPPHKGVSEVVNDLNGRLINFWNVLRHPGLFPEFFRRASMTPFSGDHWEASSVAMDMHDRENLEGRIPTDDDLIWRAVSFFIVNRQSLAGRMKSFTAITKTRTRSRMNNEVSAWLSAVDGLPEVHDRLKRVLILPPQPALDVLYKFNTPDTLHYLDPPYMHETRATTAEYGEHEMDAHDHIELLDIITNYAKSKIMISGYRSETYDVGLHDWNRHDYNIVNQASHARVKEMKTESLWCNF